MKICDIHPDCHSQGCNQDPACCLRVKDMNRGVDKVSLIAQSYRHSAIGVAFAAVLMQAPPIEHGEA